MIPRIGKMVSGLILLSAPSSDVYAKNNVLPVEQVGNEKPEKKQTDAIQPPDTIRNIFRGIITERDTKESLIAASIIIAGTRIGALADIDGKFSVKIPDDQLKDSVHFEVSYIAYEKKRITISKNDLISEQSILLSLSTNSGQEIITEVGLISLNVTELDLVGELIVEKKHKWWKRKHKR